MWWLEGFWLSQPLGHVGKLRVGTWLSVEHCLACNCCGSSLQHCPDSVDLLYRYPSFSAFLWPVTAFLFCFIVFVVVFPQTAGSSCPVNTMQQPSPPCGLCTPLSYLGCTFLMHFFWNLLSSKGFLSILLALPSLS